MALSLSDRSDKIVQAEIRAMSVECARVGGINLAQGVCDTEIPRVVQVGAQRAMDEGINSYTRHDGLARLREAIAGKMNQFNGIQADPETDIVVSGGSTGAFYCTCLALLNPGDEVIVFQPYYGYHVNTLLAVEAVPVYVALPPPDWTFSPEALEEATTSRTRAVVINTPSNPSGRVFSRQELEWIAEWAERHDLFLITDEIYEYFVYDGLQHISPGSLPGMGDRTITISGYSKTFSITGWRIGYSVSDKRWARMIGYINDLVYVCAPAPLQVGVAEGIEQLAPSFYRDLAAEYEKKRDRICTVLKAVGIRPVVPQGAYYILADASGLPGNTSKEKAMALLHETGVATVPGDSFFAGDEGRNLLRFCFAKSDEELDEACKRMSRWQADHSSARQMRAGD